MYWQLLYNSLLVPLGWIVLRFLSLFDAKVRQGLRGRKKLFEELEEKLSHLDPQAQRIWFHASSMGEFEQAKPIIEELHRRRPSVNVIVTFFSPSGYQHSLHYKFANIISYIPFDSKRNARRFIDMVRPCAAVIVRYDIWPNHLWELRRCEIPTFIASATLRANTVRRFFFLRQFHRELYNALDYILAVSEEDRKVFAAFKLHHPHLEAIGDTRYDQVSQRSLNAQRLSLLAADVTKGKRMLVIGSSWREDEARLLPACLKLLSHHPEVLVVIVPHEPTLEHLDQLEHDMNGSVSSIRMSGLQQYTNENVLIVDSVGILMALYKYAAVAYVGGGFGSGIHNVLEPASYGIPTIIGPHHENSREAVRLVLEGAAFVGADAEEFYGHLKSLFEDESARQRAGKRALTLVQSNTGATDRFLSYLEKVL